MQSLMEATFERMVLSMRVDGNYIRMSGSIVWEIDDRGYARKHGSIMYSVDGYTGSERMKQKVAAFLLFFAD